MNICTKDAQCRVLLIEDYPDHATLVDVVIRQYGKDGFSLCHHQTLAEGLDCITKHDAGPIDIILLDLHLPDSSGLATLKTVRAAATDIAIVVMTSLDDESMAEAALELGAQDYVIKTDILAGGRSLDRIMRFAIARNIWSRASQRRSLKLGEAEAVIEDSRALQLVREVKEELKQDFEDLKQDAADTVKKGH